MTKYKCNKPCIQRKSCSHAKLHFKTNDCATGCDNGAECVIVQEHETSEILQDCATDGIKAITDERGRNYGNPVDHFACTRDLFSAWMNRRMDAICKGAFIPDTPKEDAVRHAVYMMCDKLARSANNIMHKDNFDDISGYARCAKMVLGMEK